MAETALLSSTALVAIAEIGDKTQLLSFVLAARFRRPCPIVAGILVATVANHALAASLASFVASLIAPGTLAFVVGVSFLLFGVWTLKPDSLALDEGKIGGSAFVATTIAFFLVEMGDKTQLATATLAARYPGSLMSVVAGTSVGMLLANVPAVVIGEALSDRLPLKWIRWAAAASFVVMGLATFAAAGLL
jgi:putative Ca2+/H+ antiporter (TMEM165/GDT1 family)